MVIPIVLKFYFLFIFVFRIEKRRRTIVETRNLLKLFRDWCWCGCAEIDEYYADVRYERIAILNALGAYYSYLGKVETKQREKEEYFIQATKHYNKASRIDMHEPSTWVGKGQLLLAKGEVEQASAAFRITLEGDCIPALLLASQSGINWLILPCYTLLVVIHIEYY